MPRFLQVFFVFLLCTNLSTAQCYQLVWADEFSGSTLDLTKWTPQIGGGGWGNSELQHYTNRSQNIAVSGGTLKIIALQENYGGNAYTSARLQTKNQGDWRYGKMEARLKLPVAQGLYLCGGMTFWLAFQGCQFGRDETCCLQ